MLCCNHLHGFCGQTTEHCLCTDCTNYHFLFMHVLAILSGVALTGIIGGALLAFALYKYRNWEKKPRAVNGVEEKGEKVEMDIVNMS